MIKDMRSDPQPNGKSSAFFDQLKPANNKDRIKGKPNRNSKKGI